MNISRFTDVAMLLKRRIEYFVALPMGTLDQLSLGNELHEIGHGELQST